MRRLGLCALAALAALVIGGVDSRTLAAHPWLWALFAPLVVLAVVGVLMECAEVADEDRWT